MAISCNHDHQRCILTAYLDLLPSGHYVFDQSSVIDWRMKGRMRTVSVALVMCLNIGVDPPDQYRPQPTAQLQCWIDPRSLPPAKALATIGARLQQQYERWQPRARYCTSLDQTVDDLRKLCISLRRSSKSERILFHYNGHGVPRPTDNGEIWLFNKNYTQYVPLSVYELVSWLQSPTIYVFDCSNAGMIPSGFASYENQRTDPESAAQNDTIILSACSAGESIPMNPDFGVADVFTSCLTTPIQIALRWFLFTTPPFLRQISFDQIDQIPGKPNDRKTPIGELNWIFTAVTDTIAWSSLPCALFQRLFRQDLLVASQFCNYLLACRLMPGFGCRPVSQPALPDTSQHSMWQQWDLIADWACTQTRRYLQDPERYVFQTSSFFTDQLTAFEIWLDLGSESKRPLQLPVVLQVLLSQTHRLRALELLARFVDMGPWAVNQALSVGIFPYILKLLQSPTHELRNVLVFIWAKIIALDPSCQRELIKDQYHLYFISAASLKSASSLQKSLALFVVASVADNYPPGQMAFISANVFNLIFNVLSGSDTCSALLRHMALMCLGNIWKSNCNGRQLGLVHHEMLNMTLIDLVLNLALNDTYPLTRASALHSIAMFLSKPQSPSSSTPDLTEIIEFNVKMISKLCELHRDVCALVRQQLLHCIAAVIFDQLDDFISAAKSETNSDQLHGYRHSIFEVIGSLCHDPVPVVSELAHRLDKSIWARSHQTKEMAVDEDVMDELESKLFQFSCDLVRRPSDQRSQCCSAEDSYLSSDISRPGRSARLHLYDRIDSVASKIGQVADLSNCRVLLTSPLDTATHMRFHPYEPVLIATDRHRVCLINYRDMCCNAVFSNCNDQDSQITSLALLNPRYSSLILTASNDGAIRIWYSANQTEFSLRSAFSAYPTMTASLHHHLYTDWQEAHGRLISTSTATPIRIWDLNHQLCCSEITPGEDLTQIRSLCSDQDSLVFTAHADGQVRIADVRVGQYQCDIICSHTDDIIGLYSQYMTPDPILVSCSATAHVRIHDLRMPSRSLLTFHGLSSTSKSDRWTTFAISQYGNLYAGASTKQSVNIGTLSGTALNTLRHYDGFLGQRLGSVHCLTFHPRYPILAIGSHDNHIGLFSESNTNRYWDSI